MIAESATAGVGPPDGGWGWVVAVAAAVVQSQVATIPTTFGVYFIELTRTQPNSTCQPSLPAPLLPPNLTITTTEAECRAALPSALVSMVPSVMGFFMFLCCPVSTALAKVMDRPARQ